MAHARKDTLVNPRSWARHLRPFDKRKTSKRERRAAVKDVRKET